MTSYQIGLWRWIETSDMWTKRISSNPADEIAVRLFWTNNPEGNWQVIVPLLDGKIFTQMVNDPHRGMAIADAVYATR